MSYKINLNSDLGEAFGAWPMGDDAAMMDIVRSANIACGFHAGDPSVMMRTVKTALAKGVSLGAHPGYPDLQGFGRRVMSLSLAEVEAMVAYQIGALSAIAANCGGQVTHVKPHGALSNQAAVNSDLANALARTIKAVDSRLIFLVPTGSEMAKAAKKYGLATAEEVFADRNYDDNGNLVPRGSPDAMIHDSEEAAENVMRMITNGVIRSVSGKDVPCSVHSVCVHGDEATAVTMARRLRTILETNGIDIVALTDLGLATS
jgi:UPF0271 protein